MKQVLLLSGLFLLLLTGCQKDEIQVAELDSQASFRKKGNEEIERPFRGRLFGRIPTATATCEDRRDISTGQLKGFFSQLGRTSLEYTTCGSLFLAGKPASNRIEGSGGDLQVRGEYFFPPRDTLIIFFRVIDYSEDDSNGPNTFEGDFVIQGSKGKRTRLEEARGQGKVRATFRVDPHDPAHTRVSLKYDGKIIY